MCDFNQEDAFISYRIGMIFVSSSSFESRKKRVLDSIVTFYVPMCVAVVGGDQRKFCIHVQARDERKEDVML